jgi:threonine/homoserine/homoserine lactone efflux protein
MLTYGIFGSFLGLSAGLAPGPLLALVVSETLRHDIKAGIQVALSPLLTDLPIILLSVLVLSRLSGHKSLLGFLSLVGGLVLFYMAYQGFRVKTGDFEPSQEVPKSLMKGMAVNLSNPHPYLFWMSVGAPTITKALDQGIGAALSFLGGFYLFLVGSKVLLALAVGRSKTFLKGSRYLWSLRLLSFILCLFALKLIGEGLSSFFSLDLPFLTF